MPTPTKEHHATMPTVTVSTRRFGAVDVPAEEILEFPNGLVGLGGSRYLLICTDPDSPFRWLQSVDDPDLALPVTNPWVFFPDFCLVLGDDATERIGVPPDATDVDVWVTVRAAGAPGDFSANLRAPIVVRRGRGHQVINEAPGTSMRAPLFPAAAEPAAAAPAA